jgi:hypothetical protein
MLSKSYCLRRTVRYLTKANEKDKFTVSMLAAYIEFAVHLMSNPSLARAAKAGSDSCNRVEQKEGGAVPASCGERTHQRAIYICRRSRNSTILALRREKGKSTESMIVSFHAAALLKKPAPGNHAGRYLTKVYDLSALAYVEAAMTDGKEGYRLSKDRLQQ